MTTTRFPSSDIAVSVILIFLPSGVLLSTTLDDHLAYVVCPLQEGIEGPLQRHRLEAHSLRDNRLQLPFFVPGHGLPESVDQLRPPSFVVCVDTVPAEVSNDHLRPATF